MLLVRGRGRGYRFQNSLHRPQKLLFFPVLFPSSVFPVIFPFPSFFLSQLPSFLTFFSSLHSSFFFILPFPSFFHSLHSSSPNILLSLHSSVPSILPFPRFFLSLNPSFQSFFLSLHSSFPIISPFSLQSLIDLCVFYILFVHPGKIVDLGISLVTSFM